MVVCCSNQTSESLPEFDNSLWNSIIEKTAPIPIAFGLRALGVRVKMPESLQGGTQPIEDAMSALEKVQRVEVELVTRPMQPKDIAQF